MTLHFGILGILFLLVIFVMVTAWHKLQLREARNGYFSLANVKFGIVASLLLLLLGFLSIYTLNNYFFADEHIYRNTDHHALRLDGITIGSPRGFIVAGASSRAFFDDDHTGGSVTVADAGEGDSLQLRLANFTRPIFINHYNSKGRCTTRTLLDGSPLLCFGQQDTLFLRTKDQSIYRFYIKVIANDSVDYHLILPDGTDCLTDEHRFLTQGLPLAVLTQGTFNSGADFSDIHILRTTMHLQVNKNEHIDSYHNVGYVVEVQSGNLGNIRHEDNYVVDGRTQHTHWQSLRQPGTETLSLPLNAVFSIGYGASTTRPACFTRYEDGSSLALLFKMPFYHYLSQYDDEERSTVTVCTSVNAGSDLADLPESVILFDFFSHADNNNNMRPVTLTFSSGPTTQELALRYSSGQGQTEQTACAGDRLQGTAAVSNSHHVEWLLSLEDLKGTAPWTADGIKWRMALFVLMLALLMLWGSATGMTTKGAARRNMFTTVEFVAYAVAIYLVAFRWFLLWRTSVFPPVEEVSYFDFFGLFRNLGNGHLLTVAMFAMVAVIAIGKALILRNVSVTTTLGGVLGRAKRPLGDDRRRLPEQESRAAHYTGRNATLGGVAHYAALVVVGAVVFVLAKWVFSGTPVVRISLPVFTYLAFTAIIDRWLSAGCDDNRDGLFRLEDRDRQRSFWQHHTPLRLIVGHVATTVLFAAMLLVIDSGYGILFLTFSVFWTLWLLQQHVGYYMLREHWRVGVILLLLLVMGWLIYSYKDIIGFADSSTTLTVTAVMGAAGLAVGCVLSWILNIGSISDGSHILGRISGSMTLKGWLVLPVAMALVFMAGGWGFRHYLKDSGQHTAQRIAVHFTKPDDVMEMITDDATEQRYLQAALNHAAIGHYTDCGGDVSLAFGDDKHGYFNMLPHSKVGALWNAQLTDISLVRFVIGEHSGWLPLVLIAFFLLMVVAAARQPLQHRWARSLLIQVPLLLFVHALIVWMATTQRFIFLGQDFPMVSINSRLTLVYYFGLTVVWVLVALYEKRNFYKLYTVDADGHPQNNDAADPLTSKTASHAPNYWRFTFARTDARRAGVALLLCMVGAALASRGTTDNALQLKHLMDRLSQRITQVNERLLDYQENVPMRLQHDMSGAMSAFSQAENIDSLLADFPFAQRLWHRYLQRDSRNNNAHLILHARLNREGRVVLQAQNKFWLPTLPAAGDEQWRGSIWAADGHYLARNILLNGRPTLFYTQSKALFWVRNLASEIAREQPAEDVVLTLSPTLTDTLYRRLSAARPERSSVIVANGNGDVWAMADFDRRYAFEPNDRRSIQRFTDSLYMYGMVGSETERRAFGNKNLMHVQRGPGSSQKPLLWTAVASQVDLPWQSLYIAPYDNKVEAADTFRYRIRHFNGQPFMSHLPFNTLKSDEIHGQRLGVRAYMSHSSNVYNALMAYIGSFTADELSVPSFRSPAATHDGTTLLARVRPSETTRTDAYRQRFPLLTMSGELLSLNKGLQPGSVEGCLLEEAMQRLFLADEADVASSDGYVSAPGPGIDADKRLNNYAYVEASHMNSREGRSTPLLMEKAIRSTAIGAQVVWEVTPWKMAEAFGRMATLNDALRLSVFSGDRKSYQRFEGLSNGYLDARPEQLLGMSDVMATGTAWRMKPILGLRTTGDDASWCIGGKWFVYAKTGTIAGSRREDDRHRLGVIIADHDLATTPPERLDDVRFVVLYFTTDYRAQWYAYARVILDVMASEEFKNYMQR